MKRYLVYILLLVCVASFGQGNQYLFTNLDKKQGLSHNRVLCFYRDNKGFLWVGTNEGLCRFDGYSFKVFKNNPKDSNSIRDNSIQKIFQDNKGLLWVWNGDYLDILDPETETFKHQQNLFNNRIQVPLVSKWFAFYDKSMNIIYANSITGLYKYIASSDSLLPIDFPYVSLSKTIASATIDNDGYLWVVCTKGMLYKLHKENYNIIDSIELDNNFDNRYQIFIDNENDIWLRDQNNGTGIYYLKNNTHKIAHFYIDSEVGRLNSNYVTGIIQNADGKIWVTVDHGGLNIIDKKDFSVQYILNNPFNERSLCDNALTAIYKDNQGFVWLGSFKRGFSYYHPKLFNFSLYKINIENSKAPAFNDIDNFAEDSKGNLWIGTNGGGLIYFDRKNNTFKQYVNDPKDPNSLSANVIIGLYVDKNDRVWAGTYFGGISVFNGHNFTRIKNIANDHASLSDDRVWDICPASDGKYWVATLLGGVNVLNPNTLKVEKVFRWDSNNSIRSNVIWSVFEDKNKIMWFATVDGVRSYDRKTDKFEYFMHDDKDSQSLSKNFVYDIFEDSRGMFWVATSDGLNILDRKTKKFKVFKKEDGLPSNMILTITEDRNHNLWFSTSNGLSCLILNKNKEGSYSFRFKNYDVLDGLQGNEFNEKAALLTRNGELLFGGGNGFNMINPDNIAVENLDINIVFTGFQVYNKPVATSEMVNGRVLLKKDIADTREIALSYKENVFSVEFASLNFFHPERHSYRYKLENFSSEWMYTDGFSRKATYTNLNPGTYIFRVQVTNTDGSWSNNEATLEIKITPPWWKTTIFRIFAILVILCISLIVYLRRILQLKAHQIELENKVKERTNQLSEANSLLEERQEEISIQNEELARHRNQLEMLVEERTVELEKAKLKAEESDKLKSAFLANMSHEIRTPMNAIIGFSTLLADEDVTLDERKEFIDIINKSCDSLLVLINDILDLSKIEANQVKIFKSYFNVNTLLGELENYYKLNKKSELALLFDSRNQNPNLKLYNDSVRFRQILTNLLDNAYKYTEHGSIHFGYQAYPNEIEFYITDTGVGIKNEDKGKLFNYFTKIEGNSKLYRGSGLGLAICKRIVELMGGNIWLESEYGKGSTFRFTLPYSAADDAVDENETANNFVKRKYSFNNLTILIAEDEEANFNYLKTVLRSYNVNIVWKKNGKEAVDYFMGLENKDNLIILMDIKMPVMNGVEAIKEIRKEDKHVPVIAVTAYAMETEKYEILTNSFNDYLVKPLRPEVLIDAIVKIVNH